MEANDTDYRVNRGGAIEYSNYPSSSRMCDPIYFSNPTVGFRVTLYL